MSGGSLINIGELSKPATVLIEKISDAVGVLYEPKRIRNEAQANADAALIEASSVLKITDLERRAMGRFVHEQAREQKNIEDITTKALPYLKEDANPAAIDEDWLADFFSRSRKVSNDQMQSLWSRILSGEANEPESVSRRTLEFVGSMDRSDADLFSQICNLSDSSFEQPLVFDMQDSILDEVGLQYTDIAHLDSIGLIQLWDGLGCFSRQGIQGPIRIMLSGRLLQIEFDKLPKPKQEKLEVGKILFTKTGKELRRFVSIERTDEFYQHCVDYWQSNGYVLSSPL